MTHSPALAVLTAAQMRDSDTYTMNQPGITSRMLMETAAHAVADCLAAKDAWGHRVLFICGWGNNGGDGFAAARFLAEDYGDQGFTAAICYLGSWDQDGYPDLSRMSEECARQYQLSEKAGLKIHRPQALDELLKTHDIVVDAVFGIGLSRPVEGLIARVFDAVVASRLPVVAVDIPSGLATDTGKALGRVLPAQMTVTMQNLKPGHLLYPGTEWCGELHVADIGVMLHPAVEPYAYVPNRALLNEVLPPRSRRSHKGTYGRLCLICGSSGMSGAAYMAAKAALRSGIGLAHILTTEDNRTILQSMLPEAIVSTYDPDGPDPAALRRVLTQASGFVIGCGLGRTEASADLLRMVLDMIPVDHTIPVVFDADALNLLGDDETLWETRLLSRHENPVVITPHPSEMRMLCGDSLREILDDLPHTAEEYAVSRNVTVVLKDAHTVIASPDGALFFNVSGNAGMATGGSGDVLAGLMGSLLVQRRNSLCDYVDDWSEMDETDGTDHPITAAEVAAAAVYIHGTAGDRAAADIGEIGMLPTDLIDRIPAILRHLSDTRTMLFT